MKPVNILSTGIHSALAQDPSILSVRLAVWLLNKDNHPDYRNPSVTPDAVPLPTDHELCSLGMPRNIAKRASQAERYAFMAVSQAMSAVFAHTNPDSRTMTDPVWDTRSVRLGIIVASDASALPHAEALTATVTDASPSVSATVTDASPSVSTTVTDASPSVYPAVNGAPASIPSRLALQCLTSDVSSFLAPLVGARAFAFTVGAACASSHLALHTAARYLDAGLADMILVVGVSETGDTAHLAFNALGIDGVHPSGGAAAALLASEKVHDDLSIHDIHFPKQLFPRITGFGIAQSPHRVTPDTTAMTTAMTTAIGSANLSPRDIDIILAHHTGSSLGDAVEDTAISELYKEPYYRPFLCPTKRLHGHEMWMSGLSQLVESVALFNVNNRLGLHNHRILCNSFAFGGTYSAFVVES